MSSSTGRRFMLSPEKDVEVAIRSTKEDRPSNRVRDARYRVVKDACVVGEEARREYGNLLGA